MKILFSLLVFICGIFSSSYAPAQSLAEQVAELKQINEAQSKNLAQALNQVQEITSQFQQFQGQVEQAAYLSGQHQKQIQDSSRRLEVAEDKIQSLVSQLEEIKAAGLLPAAQAKKLEEFQAYQKVLSRFNTADYKGAVDGFRALITKNPKGFLTENAQYWIGESFYFLRDYTAAIAEYQKLIKDFPQGKKAAMALLKQGFSFYEMKSYDEAKLFLTKVSTQYPATLVSSLAEDRIQEINHLLEAKTKGTPKPSGT